MDFEVDFKVNLELEFSSHPMQGTVLDSVLHALDFQIPVLDSSIFLKIGTWISDSNCWWDSEFIELDSGFQRPGFRIPQANLFRVPDSSSKTFHPYIRAIRIMLPK